MGLHLRRARSACRANRIKWARPARFECFDSTRRAFHASLACLAPSGRFVQAWNAGAYPAEDFIRDRADPVGHFISPDRFPSLLPNQRDDLTHLYRCEVGDI